MNKPIGTYDKIEPLVDLIKLQITTEFSNCTPGKKRNLNLLFSIEKDENGDLKLIKVRKNNEN